VTSVLIAGGLLRRFEDAFSDEFLTGKFKAGLQRCHPLERRTGYRISFHLVKSR
jgi:hypothetical protein